MKKLKKKELGGEQPGPKKPIITNNPNDPALRRYQDSLAYYKAGQLENAAQIKYTNAVANDPNHNLDQPEGDELWKRSSETNNLHSNTIDKPIPINLPVYDHVTNKVKMGQYDTYAKPIQPIEYKRTNSQQGRTPITVNDPNDPRLKAYQDSLSNNQKFVNVQNFFSKEGYPMKDTKDGKAYFSTIPSFNPWKEIMLGHSEGVTSKDFNFEHSYTGNDEGRNEDYGYTKEGVRKAEKIFSSPIYQKPVQPVIYQKTINNKKQQLEVSQDKPWQRLPNGETIPINGVTPQLGSIPQQITTPSLNIEPKYSGDYSVTNRTNKGDWDQKTQRFPNSESFEAYISAMRESGQQPNTVSRSSNSGQALFQRRKGGQIPKASEGTPFTGYTSNMGLWNVTPQFPPMFPQQQGFKLQDQPGDLVSPFTPMNPYPQKKNTQRTFDVEGASGLIGGMSFFNDISTRIPDAKIYNNQVNRATSDSQFPTYNPALRRGYIDPNSGMTAPNLQTYTQFANNPAANYYGTPPIAQDGMSLPDLSGPQSSLESIDAQVDAMGVPAGFAPSFTSPLTPSGTPSNINKAPDNSTTSDDYNKIKEFVKSQEGFTKKAKWDYKQFSNGFGTKAKYPGEVVSKEEADARLDQELVPITEKIKNSVNTTLSPDQLTAITSMAYNGGFGVVKKIIKQINQGAHPSQISDLISHTATTVNNGAQVLGALVKRRKEEADMFLKYKAGGEYELSDQQIKDLQNQGYELEFS